MIGGFILGRRRGGAALRYAGGKAKGAAASVTPDSSKGQLNDPALARKVESEIFREVQDADKGKVVINAENGTIYLRGEVKRPEQIHALCDAAAKVDGVRSVESLLHLPKTPARMKS